MATYQKRGYKKSVEIEAEEIIEEEEVINTEDSTTAEIFETLEEKANLSEKWIEQNSKVLLMSLVGAVVLIFGIMGYNQFIKIPGEKKAANALTFGKKEFQNANLTKSEEGFKLALNGNENNSGLVAVADEYGSTNAGNLAKYYAGVAYVNLKDYENGINYLESVSSDDSVLKTIVNGTLGDAYYAQNNKEKALSYFKEAASASTNEAIAPVYLLKAGKLALSLNEYSDAKELLENIKNSYPNTTQAKEIDLFLNQANYGK